MAKGDSEFAVAGPECQEVAGEHRRAVTRPHRGRSPGTGDPDQAASMGVGPKTWARGEPDAWERARPVRRCGPGKRTLRKKHTAPRPDPYLTLLELLAQCYAPRAESLAKPALWTQRRVA